MVEMEGVTNRFTGCRTLGRMPQLTAFGLAEAMAHSTTTLDVKNFGAYEFSPTSLPQDMELYAAVEGQIGTRGLGGLPAGTASTCESCGEAEVVVQYADDENIEGEPYVDRNGEPYQKCRSRCGRRFLVFTHNEGIYPVRPGDRVRLKRSGRYWNAIEKL